MECFEPFRVVGSVCGRVPVSATLLYGTPMLMAATGRTYQLYKGKELALVRGGPTFECPIAAVAQAGRYRAVAEGPRVHVLSHHKLLWTALHEPTTLPEVTLLLAQDDLLFCVGSDTRVVVRELKTGRVLQEMLVAGSETPTCVALLPAYRSKLLLATAQGSLQLFNYRSGALLWESRRTEGGEAITALVCSAYKDIVAYGTAGGALVLLDVGRDEVITTFAHQAGAAVTALAFRADKDGVLVSGTSRGDVVLWDLEARVMDGVLTRAKQVQSERDAMESPHTGAVHTLLTFPPQPSASSADSAQVTALLVSAGADNAVMQFRFDTVDGLGLLVRERRGHMGPCTAARFFNGDLLVTAGADRALRVTHVFSDRASWELSQGRLGKRGRERQMGREALKAPPVTRLASSTTRNYQWASLVSLHAASAQMAAWRMDTRALDFKISAIETSAHTAKAVTVSDCGNYAIVGYSSGNVAVVSLQNHGIRQLVDASLPGPARAHSGSVECVEVTCGNTVVATAGLDGRVRLWELSSGALLDTIVAGAPMTHSCVHPSSALLVVAMGCVLRVYACDVVRSAALPVAERHRPVRELQGHRAPVTALALAPVSERCVVSASADAALLLWDLAAAACVGQYRFHAPAQSLHFHPDGLFLASTHAGEGGAFLWVNSLRYGFVPEVVPDPLARPTGTLPLLHFPTAHGGSEDADEDDVRRAAAAEEEEEAQAQAQGPQALAAAGGESAEGPALFDASADIALAQRRRNEAEWARLDAIETEGLALSRVPRSVWFSLTVLDQIKEKNQPLLPPKKKDVPFFLPTTDELRPTFIIALDKAAGAAGPDRDGRVRQADLAAPTPTQAMLLADEHEALMAHLLANAAATASALDLEVRQAVGYTDGVDYSAAELDRMVRCARGLLRFLAHWLERREEVDLVQGLLTATLRAHGVFFTQLGAEVLREELERVAAAQEVVQRQLDHLTAFPYALSSTFSGTSTW